MSISDVFVDLRLGAELAFDLARLRVMLVGTGSFAPVDVPIGAQRIELANGTIAVIDTARNLARLGDGPSYDLTMPESFAAFMGDLDVSIVDGSPGFPTIGFLIADEIGHYLNTVNTQLGYPYPLENLLPDRIDQGAIEMGRWEPNTRTSAFLDALASDRSPNRHRADFDARRGLPSPDHADMDLMLRARWFHQVDGWTGNDFSVHEPNVWATGGFFWQRIETQPTLIASEMIMAGCGGRAIRGDGEPTTGRRLGEGVDYYALRLAYGGTYILADVDSSSGEIEAWAVPSYVDGMFKSDTPRLMAYLEDEILPQKAPAPGR